MATQHRLHLLRPAYRIRVHPLSAEAVELGNGEPRQALERSRLTGTHVTGNHRNQMAEKQLSLFTGPSPQLSTAPFSNVLLNPLHPRAAEIQLVDQQPFRFDPRLRPSR